MRKKLLILLIISVVVISAIIATYVVIWNKQADKIEQQLKVVVSRINSLDIDTEVRDSGAAIRLGDISISGMWDFSFDIKLGASRILLNKDIFKNAILLGQNDSYSIELDKLDISIPIFKSGITITLPKQLYYFDYAVKFKHKNPIIKIDTDESFFSSMMNDCDLACMLKSGKLFNLKKIDISFDGYEILKRGGEKLSSSSYGNFSFSQQPSDNGELIKLSIKLDGYAANDSYFDDLTEQFRYSADLSDKNRKGFLSLYSLLKEYNKEFELTDYNISLEYDGPTNAYSFIKPDAKVEIRVNNLDLINKIFAIAVAGQIQVMRSDKIPQTNFNIQISNLDSFIEYFSDLYNIFTQELDISDLMARNFIPGKEIGEASDSNYEEISAQDKELYIAFLRKMVAAESDGQDISLQITSNNDGITIGNYSLQDAVNQYLQYKYDGIDSE